MGPGKPNVSLTLKWDFTCSSFLFFLLQNFISIEELTAELLPWGMVPFELVLNVWRKWNSDFFSFRKERQNKAGFLKWLMKVNFSCDKNDKNFSVSKRHRGYSEATWVTRSESSQDWLVPWKFINQGNRTHSWFTGRLPQALWDKGGTSRVRSYPPKGFPFPIQLNCLRAHSFQHPKWNWGEFRKMYQMLSFKKLR